MAEPSQSVADDRRGQKPAPIARDPGDRQHPRTENGAKVMQSTGARIGMGHEVAPPELGVGHPLLVTPAKEYVKNYRGEPRIAHRVIPAKAGIQRFQSLDLGPRFRGGDDLALGTDSFTRSKARVQGPLGSGCADAPRC